MTRQSPDPTAQFPDEDEVDPPVEARSTDSAPIPGRSPTVTVRRGWLDRRRDRIVAEIERNRRGDYKVPTWVLVVLLVAIVAGWAALIIFS